MLITYVICFAWALFYYGFLFIGLVFNDWL